MDGVAEVWVVLVLGSCCLVIVGDMGGDEEDGGEDWELELEAVDGEELEEVVGVLDVDVVGNEDEDADEEEEELREELSIKLAELLSVRVSVKVFAFPPTLSEPAKI